MPAGATYEPLSTTTLTGATASITISSISQAYTDLVMVVSAADSGAANCFLQVGNGSIDTASNYSVTILTGNGSTAYSYRESSKTNMLYGFESTPPTSPSFGTYIFNFMNYSNTTTYKTTLIRANSAATGTDGIVGLWRSTSAIDTVKISLQGAVTYSAGTTLTLYGIKAA